MVIFVIAMVFSQTFQKIVYDAGGSYSPNLGNAIQTSDGGFAICDQGGAVVKIDVEGNFQWFSSFDEPSYSITMQKLIQTTDNGYVLAGYGESYLKKDIIVTKFNSSGVLSWSESCDIDSLDEAWGIIETAWDMGLLILGSGISSGAPFSVGLVIKLDGSGGFQWVRNFYGPTGSSNLLDAVELPNNDLVIVGYTESFGAGGADGWVFKIDQNGIPQPGYFKNTFGGTQDDYLSIIKRTSDGGFILAGNTYSFGAGSQDVYIVKIDSLGNLEWSRTFGGTDNDFPLDIVQTSDNGYAIAGWTLSFSSLWDAFVIKIDQNGNLQWSKIYGTTTSDDWLNSIFEISGKLYSFGWTNGFIWPQSHIYLIKADANGVSGCNESDVNFQITSPPTSVSSGLSIGYPSVAINPIGSAGASVNLTTYTLCETSVQEEVQKVERKINYQVKNSLLIFETPLNYRIFKEDGRIYKKGFGKTVELKKGIYFVIAGDKKFKVTIK